MDNVQVAPAVLAYTKNELKHRIASVPDAKILHIDVMDGRFVNNTTLSAEELQDLPDDKEIEFHLMVKDPMSYIQQLPGGENKIFEVHIESVNDYQMDGIKALVKNKGSRLAWALNPPTPIDRLEKHLEVVEQVLLMTVNPGWAGQSYISDVEEKIRTLRKHHPKLVIEVDGGITNSTLPRAISAGANRLTAASAIFGADEPNAALKEITKLANSSKK